MHTNRKLGWALALWVCAGTMFAQTAEVTGRITDPSMAVVPGVSVTVTNVETGVKRETKSNGEGYYSIPALKPGSYSIGAQKEGFRSSIRSGVHLAVDQVAKIDFSIEVGSVTDSISVQANAAVLETENAAIGQVISTKSIEDLPLNGRQFTQLGLLIPGSATGGAGTLSSNPTLVINGMRRDYVGYTIDGVDNLDQTSLGATQLTSIDVIQEFRIQYSTYSADSGRQPAGLNLVTKSGTSAFHGSAFEFIRNSDMDSRNFFDLQSPAPLKRNQFGATLGGPVPVPGHRTFFFIGYEGTRQPKGLTNTATVPTLAQSSGNLAGLSPIFDPAAFNSATNTRQPFPGNLIPSSRIEPIAKRLISYFPAPNVGANRFVSNPIDRLSEDQANIRVDHLISPKDQIFGRYSYDPKREAVPTGTLLLSTSNNNLDTTNAVISETHTFSPSVVNETRIGYLRWRLFNIPSNNNVDIIDQVGIQGLDIRGPGVQGFPSLSISGYATFSNATHFEQSFNNFNYVDNLSVTRGKHLLKFGADVRRQQRNVWNDIGSRGSFTFNGSFTSNPGNSNTGAALGDFLLGYPSSTARAFPSLAFEQRWANVSGYGQDEWKVTSRFTLNIGLRYELNTAPVDRHNLQSNFDPQIGKEVVATDSHGQISSEAQMFASFLAGIQNLMVPATQTNLPARSLRFGDHDSFAPRFGFAWQLGSNTVLRGGYGIYYALGNGARFSEFAGAIPFGLSQTFTANTLVPNLTLEQPFGGPANLPLPNVYQEQINWRDPYYQQYSLTLQRTLGAATVVEAGFVGNKGTHVELTRLTNDPLPGPGNIQPRRPFPLFGSINSDEATGTSDFNSLQVKIERRFSGGLSFLASYVYSKSVDTASTSAGSGVLSTQNPRLDRAASDFDMPHRVVASWVYELPFGAGRRYLKDGNIVGQVLGGWQLTGIFTAQSGLPFSVTTGRDTANIGKSNRPDRICDGRSSDPTLSRWYNLSCFSNPVPYLFGTAGRNILRTDKFVNVDFGGFKNFKLKEAITLQIRGELFNILNHPNFNAPDNNINSSTAAQVLSAAPGRVVQFGAKINF